MENQHWNAAYSAAFLFVLGFFVALGVMQADRPPWQDEAAILENLGLPWRAYFSALPFNDQAAPPFTLIAHDLMWRLSGESLETMRLLSLGMTATVLGGAGVAASRRQDITMLIALIILMTNATVLIYSTEIKHYIFEFCATLLLLHVAIVLNPTRPRGIIVLFSMSVLVSLFSFSSMFVSVIIFLDIVLFRARGRIRLFWLLALVSFVLVWVGLYLTIFKPMTYFQITNYPEAYENNTLLAQIQSGAFGFVKPLKQLLLPTYFGIALLVGFVFFVFRRGEIGASYGIGHPDLLPIRLATGLIGALLVLSLIGQYPLFSNRQLLFTYPSKALAVAALMVFVLRVGNTERLSRPVLALLTAALAAPGAIHNGIQSQFGLYVFQDTQALYEHLQTSPEIPVVADPIFAPTLRHYLRHDDQTTLTVLGALPFDTREMASTMDVVAKLNAGAVDELNDHIWSPLREGDTYQAYTDYVVRLAAEAGRITFAAAQFTNTQEDFLVQSVTAVGCEVSREFKGPNVRAFDIRCDS